MTAVAVVASYRVTAPAVVAKVSSDTGEGYFYRGAVLPAGVSPVECRRLEAMGLVAVVAAVPVLAVSK